MLKRDRRQIIKQIEARVKNMSGTAEFSTTDSSIYVNYDTPYAYDHIDNKTGYFPTRAHGWSPQLVSYIQDVACTVALAIIDEILTEQEMEKKFNERAEQDLLQ